MLCIFKRRARIAGVAAERNECQQGVTIVRMPRQIFFEFRHRVAHAPGRMQGNRVDIRISGLIRIEFGGAMQFAERIVGPFLPHKRQAERVVQARVMR